MQTNSVSRFLEWVDSFLNFEKLPQKNMFWLDMMEYMCGKLDNPQNLFPCYHVAGSKGKGSVSAMISSILTESGLKTGIYSSPHIEDFRERIRLNDAFFDEKVYESAAKELKERFESFEEGRPKDRVVTWFELVTLFGFLCMKHGKVNEAVYEVGLGGRLDATNVINPAVCVINTIELEHTEFLGDTLEKIAAEKGGIIKKGIPVVISSQTQNVKTVFKQIAEEKAAPLYFEEDYLKSLSTEYVSDGNSRYMKVHIDSKLFNRPLCYKTSMFGDFQAHNAFIAAMAVKLVHPEINEDIIEKGLSKVTLPARFEILSENNIIIDGAHTVKSIGFTMETFEKLYSGKNAHLLFACAADKDVEHIAKAFDGRFKRVTLTRPGETKACNPEKMKEAFSKTKLLFSYDEDYKRAITFAIENAKKETAVLLICGSFYLASEVKKILNS